MIYKQEVVCCDGLGEEKCGVSYCDECFSCYDLNYEEAIAMEDWRCFVCQNVCKCSKCAQEDPLPTLPNLNEGISSYGNQRVAPSEDIDQLRLPPITQQKIFRDNCIEVDVMQLLAGNSVERRMNEHQNTWLNNIDSPQPPVLMREEREKGCQNCKETLTKLKNQVANMMQEIEFLKKVCGFPGQNQQQIYYPHYYQQKNQENQQQFLPNLPNYLNYPQQMPNQEYYMAENNSITEFAQKDQRL